MALQKTTSPAFTERAFLRRFWLGVALINLFMVAMTAYWLHLSRSQDLNDGGINSRNLATALDQSIFGTIRSADLALLMVVDAYSRQTANGSRANAGELTELLTRQEARLPDVESLRAADADGTVKYGLGIPGNSAVSIADREFFVRVRDNANAELVFSQPLFARISQKWVITLSRRLVNGDGSFGGVVYANLALDYLGASFARLNVGPRGAVTLRDGELGIIARHPEPQGPGSVVGNRNVSREFRELIASGQIIGSLRVRAGLDNIERIIAFRKIGSYPLYIIVGLAVDDVLAEWRSEATTAAGLVALFILSTLGLSWLIVTAWRRQALITAALTQEEAKFHTLADYTYDWEYWQGPDGQEIRYMTPACERVTGYTVAEFVAAPSLLVEIIHPDDRHLMVAHIARYTSHAGSTLDFRIVRRDGALRWIAHACRPVYGADQQFLGRRVGNRDITERKQVEDALKTSEERLRVAQHIAQLGSWELDLITHALYWSEETFRIFETTPEEFTPSYKTFLAAIHPEDREHVSLAYTSALKNHQPFEITHRLLLPDDMVKYVHEHCETVYDEAGAPLRSCGTVQDVTLRVLTEESLRESEERFRTIADYTYDWEYWQGPQGEFLYISPSCQRVTGYSQAEFISRPTLLLDIVHPEDRPLMQSHLDNGCQAENDSLDFRIVTKEGEVRWLAHGCRTVYAKDGRLMGRRASNRDITDRKRIEEEVQHLAYFDTLTDLPNRRMLLDRLEKALSQAKRFQRSLAIMFLDLDNFKRINDTLGHAAGDELLKEVAQRLATCVRSGDTVARQGGDEFIIVLTEIAQSSDATRVAEKILAALRLPIAIGGEMLEVSTSIGIAVYPVDGTDDVQEMLKKADKAMYAAKEAGRNGYRFFEA